MAGLGGTVVSEAGKVAHSMTSTPYYRLLVRFGFSLIPFLRNILARDRKDPPPVSARALAASKRAAKPWYVYLIACRGGAIYTGIARNVAARYAQHVAGTGARYTRANPPLRLLVKFRCRNQSEASQMEAAIKRLAAADKRKLPGTTAAAAKKMLLA
jgi:putative endonuclease